MNPYSNEQIQRILENFLVGSLGFVFICLGFFALAVAYNIWKKT